MEIRIKKTENKQLGQSLITLLFFVIIGTTLLTAASIIAFQNVVSTDISQQGSLAYSIAESGAEEGILRLLRDPSYTGETISLDNGTAVVSVSNGVIISVGTYSNAVRKIQVQTAYTNNVLTITSWQEIQ